MSSRLLQLPTAWSFSGQGTRWMFTGCSIRECLFRSRKPIARVAGVDRATAAVGAKTYLI